MFLIDLTEDLVEKESGDKTDSHHGKKILDRIAVSRNKI